MSKNKFLHEEVYRGKKILDKIKDFRIVVCGVVAIGSNLVDNLTRQGFANLLMIDKDRIEAHNINTQIWSDRDIGALKSDEMKNKVFRNTGFEVESFNKELIDLTKDVSEKLNKLWFELWFDKWYLWWQDDKNSELLKISKEEFEKIHNFKIKITAVHAWLECWNLVSWLNRKVNAISIWPNIKYVHSIEEKVEIKSIEKIENILEWILKRL